MGLARRLGVKPPPSPTPSMQWELQVLRALPASQFDARYSSLEVEDHEQDIEETGFEAGRGRSAAVRQEARKELPMLGLHLRLAKKALQTQG